MAMNTDANQPGAVPAPAETEGDERLPCGRMLSQVWDAWETGSPDPHLPQCEHCTAAAHELGLLVEAVRRTHGDDLPSYDATTLIERVMDVVRLELRPGRTLPLGGHDEDLWIMEAVAAKALRAAAETMPGIQAGSCRITPLTQSGIEEPRGPLRVSLEAVVPLTRELHEVADDIRDRVYAIADGELGLRLESVDIRIIDITDAMDTVERSAP
jgi:hypothetical protein